MLLFVGALLRLLGVSFYSVLVSSLQCILYKTARVYKIEGNVYAVDPSLVGRRVELRYVPEDLGEIAVFYDGRPAGVATPFVIGRHVHRAVPQAERPVPEATAVDFLEMVAKAHEEEAGTGAKPDFRQLSFADGGDGDEEETR